MSQMISIANKPRISKDIIWRWDGEDNQIIVLSHERLPLPLILNPTAARIFSLCNGKNTLEDIAKNLCEEFGLGDFKIVLKDTQEQAEYFMNKGIVEKLERRESNVKDDY